MNKIFLTTLIAAFLFSCPELIRAQASQTKPDQLQLMKQFLGTWRGEIGQDTVIIGENKPFGTGMVCNSQIITKGKVLDSVKQLFGYDKKTDKFIMAELIRSSSAFELCTTWFTSGNTGEMVLFQDISNPGNAVLKWKYEFRSPDIIVQTAFINNKAVKEVTLVREKR
jgi:hypothetical protein